MDREIEHPLAQGRDPPVGRADGPRLVEEPACGIQPVRSRGIEPAEGPDVAKRPTRAEASTAPQRSILCTSGSWNAAMPRCCLSDQSRMQRPGPVRPARPARCAAEAWLIRVNSRRSNPRWASWWATRASPLSMTVVTPSMVIEVSAMFVARRIFRRDEGCKARSWSAAGSEP